MLLLDTHAAVWYLSNDSRLSETAAKAIEGCLKDGHRINISAISMVEIIYLVEKGRLPLKALQLLRSAVEDYPAAINIVPLDELVIQSLPDIPRETVPDMPDRIIAATAKALDITLLTRDSKIVRSNVATLW
jgi:PIN domain nuclease of toxin-antitoxin system